ncbi:MAG: hypothetical protein SGPRY_003152 [Prymnesium sp.]
MQATIDKYVSNNESPNNIDVHAKSLEVYVAELRDALALAYALGRTLVLPRWTCYCDRLWSGSDDIFKFGCMYPGSQDGNFVPFVCPMDHVLSPAAWKAEDYRDASFLESPRANHNRIVDLQLLERTAYDSLPQAAKSFALPLGTTDAEARRILQPLATTSVLRLPHARQLLCGFEAAEAVSNFNSKASSLLVVPAWCAKCFSPCRTELSKWLSPAQLQGVRGEFYCLQSPKPPSFRHGSCIKNL